MYLRCIFLAFIGLNSTWVQEVSGREGSRMLAFIKFLLLPIPGSEHVFSYHPPLVPATPSYRLENGLRSIGGTRLATGRWQGWWEKHEAALCWDSDLVT